MQVESLAVVLRPRTLWQGADLGVRLLQAWQRPIFVSHLAVAVPLCLLFYATVGVAAWLPALLIWLAKPWLDRTILFALSRALFGASTAPRDVWAARADVWRAQLAGSLTTRRLSASRAFTQPVWQLEGLKGLDRTRRIRQLAARHRSAARIMTQAFALGEFALFASLLSVPAWLTPHTGTGGLSDFFWRPDALHTLYTTAAYAAAVCFLEPFYVAAGFGMYLNRRIELEAWDIEQEFRRAFAP
jgi:hypothetical protein